MVFHLRCEIAASALLGLSGENAVGGTSSVKPRYMVGAVQFVSVVPRFRLLSNCFPISFHLHSNLFP